MVHTVVIINEEKIQIEILNHLIRDRLGYRTLTSPTMAEAKRLFDPGPMRPDLILLDWPNASSEAITYLKSLCIHAPIVVMIKFGDYEAALAALNAGAQDFLPKPVAMERISTTFRNLLLLRDARSEVQRLQRERAAAAGQDTLPPYPALPTVGIGAPFPIVSEDGNIRRMHEIEAESIRFAMQYYHGRMTEVARRLGIGRSTLYRKLSELSIRQKHAA